MNTKTPKPETTPATTRLVPRLRFPEFRDAGEWEEKNVGSVMLSVTNGLSLPQTNDPDGLMVTRIETISDTTINLHKVGHVATEEDLSDYKLKLGDILFSNINSIEHIGKCALVDKEYDLYHGMNLLRLVVDKGNNVPKFMYEILMSSSIRKDLRERANKAINQASINQTDLKKTKLVIPSLYEQQKIADCLTSLDELIQLQTRKLAALKRYKQGLLQRLFPLPGETVPRLRFPAFQDVGEWEEVRLGEICELISGYPFNGEDISENENGTPLLRGINITEGYVRHNKEIDRFYLGSTYELDKYLVKTNDLVIGMDGSKVGKNSALVTDFDSGSLLIQRVARLRCSNDVTIKFVFEIVNSEKFHKYVDIINTSSGIPHISLKQISDFSIFIPRLIEQKKIVDFLTEINVIYNESLDHFRVLKELKQALMQQLFPAPTAE